MAIASMMFLAALVAIGFYGLRDRTASALHGTLRGIKRGAPQKRPVCAMPSRLAALRDHQDFAEETQPAVLSRPADWDEG